MQNDDLKIILAKLEIIIADADHGHILEAVSQIKELKKYIETILGEQK